MLARNREDRTGLGLIQLPEGVFFQDLLGAGGREIKQGKYQLAFSQVGKAEELWIHIGNTAGDTYALTSRVIALTGHFELFLLL